MTEQQPVEVKIDSPTPQLGLASALIPYPRDDEKAKYLGYMCCGFSVREALQMVDRGKSWLSTCRLSPKFVELENSIPSYRKELSKEYLSLDFFRNFRLALEKDYRVFLRSLGMDKDSSGEPISMTQYDQSYLLKMRAQYTPQQLGILEAIVAGGSTGFDFAKWVAESQEELVKFSRTDSVTVKRSRAVEGEDSEE